MSSQDVSVSSREDLTGDGSEAGDDDGLDQSEGDGVAVAQPPRSVSQQEAIAIDGSGALEMLEQLVMTNQLGKERAARLRRKYNFLRETLEKPPRFQLHEEAFKAGIRNIVQSSSRSLENSLLVQAKELGQQLSSQHRVLERGSNFPEGDNSESSRLRHVLLQHQNDLDQSRERGDKLDHEKERLEDELDAVEKEWNRLPKREELEQHIREIERQVEELNDEISMRTQDTQRYKEELDRKNYQVSAIMQDIEELQQLEERFQDQLIEIRSSGNIPREIDAIRKQKSDTEVRIKEQAVYLGELEPQLADLEQRMSALREEQREVQGDVNQQKMTLEAGELHLEQLNKHMAEAKEREATLLEDRATLDLHTRHRGSEYRSHFEALSGKTREKDKELKFVKKAELQLSALQQSMEQHRRRFTQLGERVGEGRREMEAARGKREAIGGDVEVLRKDLAQQEGVEDVHHHSLEERNRRERMLKSQVKGQQALLHDLSRDVVTLTKSRDRDAREYYKIRHQQRSVADILKTRTGQIDEQKKKSREMETQLKDFADAYEVVKAERNKTHAQIQTMTQLLAELREKSKILQNEMEILRTSADNKDKILQKCSLVETAKVLERDTHRQELSKLRLTQSELNSTLESQREQLHKITQQINTTEQHLSRLRRRYEQAAQERNDVGLQLIERNEEVCVFYEKINVQDSVIRNANMEQASREEEIRFLKMELSRLQNDILVERKSLPEKTQLENELVTTQIELKNCVEQLHALESAVECASDPSRLRILPGSNPSCGDLRERVEKLESQLADKEQHLLEKELLHEQVGKLTDRAQQRVQSQKETTLQVAKKVNQYQSKIKDTTRKMMALVSELSMQQAQALRLQQEVREREVGLEQAYTRMESGEAPNEEAIANWERRLRVEQRRDREAEIRRKLVQEEEVHSLPGGVHTTAEPRPNAYLPTGDNDLPVPKPYGSHAPFKPTQPGANIRHIRKPELKPIDI